MRIHPSHPEPDPPNQNEPGPDQQPDPPTEPAAGGGEASQDEMKNSIIAALKQVHDPEIPVNIYDLGLIYNIDINPNNTVDVKMTLTTPNCPEAQSIPGYVEQAVQSVPGVQLANVEIVWEPQWDKDMMSDAAKLQLGFM